MLMFELLVVIAFAWLMIKSLGLVFRLTWGLAKIVASLLMVLALPLLIVCFAFFGGIMLVLPVAFVAVAFGILKICL